MLWSNADLHEAKSPNTWSLAAPWTHLDPHGEKRCSLSQTDRFSLFCALQTNKLLLYLILCASEGAPQTGLSAQSALEREGVVRSKKSRILKHTEPEMKRHYRAHPNRRGKTYEWKQPPWGEGCLLQRSHGRTRTWKSINCINWPDRDEFNALRADFFFRVKHAENDTESLRLCAAVQQNISAATAARTGSLLSHHKRRTSAIMRVKQV